MPIRIVEVLLKSRFARRYIFVKYALPVDFASGTTYRSIQEAVTALAASLRTVFEAMCKWGQTRMQS
jgi:hypothetical protein